MKLLTIALTGLATLAIAFPNAPVTDTSEAAVAPHFRNNKLFTYACDSVKINTINRLMKLNGRVLTKSVYKCPNANCYQYSTGATCGVSSIDIQARAPVPQENKHYKCSSDRASVLICRYGFCSTDKYCNLKGPGAYCHDDCICCKKDRMPKGVGEDVHKRASLESPEAPPAASQDVGISPSTVEQIPTRAIIKLDSSVIYPCKTVGIFMCDESFQAVAVCDSQNIWRQSADCRPGHCTENLNAGTAFCGARKAEDTAQDGEQKAKDMSAHAIEESSAKVVTRDLHALQACSRPGTFMCNAYHDAIYVCNSSLQWILSADCRPGHCINGPNFTAFCDASALTATEAPDLASTQQSCDKPGNFRCDATGQYIAICSPTHQWELSADCRPGNCLEKPNGTAFCVASNKPATLSAE